MLTVNFHKQFNQMGLKRAVSHYLQSAPSVGSGTKNTRCPLPWCSGFLYWRVLIGPVPRMLILPRPTLDLHSARRDYLVLTLLANHKPYMQARSQDFLGLLSFLLMMEFPALGTSVAGPADRGGGLVRWSGGIGVSDSCFVGNNRNRSLATPLPCTMM